MGAVRHLPRALWWPGAQLAGAVLARVPSRPVRQWMLNAETMTGAPPTPAQTRRAVVSWMRTTVTSMKLPGWSADEIERRVDYDPADLEMLRRAVLGRGAVVALPHMGSWDLAGAWVACHGVPISAVAEQLPDAEFELFARTRRRLGMRVYGHRDPAGDAPSPRRSGRGSAGHPGLRSRLLPARCAGQLDDRPAARSLARCRRDRPTSLCSPAPP
jgi:KDO2-lipid IV(A) lauroyltransferase